MLALAYGLGGALLPSGLPFGVVLLGLVYGALSSLTAMGLVLVYRSSRIINFAQAEIGGLAAAVTLVAVLGLHLPYVAGVLLGLLAAVLTGAVVHAVAVRPFFTSPRLILTVATIGLAQILGAGEIALPSAFNHLRQVAAFTTPFRVHLTIGPIIFNGNHLVAVGVVLAVAGGLAWFLRRSDTGVAVRAAADSGDRALLLGVPIRRLSQITWVLAALLSGISSILAAPIFGANLSVPLGPEGLLAPLAAAVVGGMENLPLTIAAALGIGVFQQVVFWNYPRSSTVDVAVFLLIMAALLLRRRRIGRGEDGGLGGFLAIREMRPMPKVLWERTTVRLAARLGGLALLLIVVVILPLTLSAAQLTLATYVAIFAIIAVSLVVLTGWAGQISLGQFAFVGVGAATTASLLVNAHADVFLALISAMAIGGVGAIAIGVPALRIPGLLLAVATLAAAVPVSTFLLNSTYFPGLNPQLVTRPVLLGRIDLGAPGSFYLFCLGGLALALWLARNFRHSRTGRAAIAVRDNSRTAAAFAVSPTRAKLTAFALSGALAGLAGGLYVIGLRGVGYNGYSPENSIQVFSMAVVGGLGSLPGALFGALYVQGAQYYLSGAAQLLATGAGLFTLLRLLPGGLGELLYRLRDLLLRRYARRQGLSVPALFDQPDGPVADGRLVPSQAAAVARAARLAGEPLLRLENVEASYGPLQVLFGVSVEVADGELVALLGTNGAGKSTVLRVATGLLPARRGRVVFGGVDITRWDPARRVRAGLAMVPGGRGVFPSLTVAENLRVAGWLVRGDATTLRLAIDRVLDLFPVLAARYHDRAEVLSGGEQQMLTLAQALLTRPRLLCIDELSLGLAPSVVSSLVSVVRELNASGVTVVVVEQSVNLATSIAERSVFMDRGQVHFSGSTRELARQPELLRAIFLAPRPHAPVRALARAPVPMGRDGLAAEPLLTMTGVRRRFGGVTALDGVDLAVHPGEILGVIGANGAGKTTLFDICSGLIPADEASIVLAGKEISRLAAFERAELGLGRSFQDARLFPNLTVAETVAVGLDRHVDVREPVACITRVGATVDSERQVARRVDELIEQLGLGRYRDSFVSELSTGTRRIVELACALAHEPAVLLLDEPSSGIAQREVEALGELLFGLREEHGLTLVVIEHDIPLISSIADELVCLDLGRVLARGAPAEVLADPQVVTAYMGTDAAAIGRSGSAPGSVRTPDGGQLLTTAQYAALAGVSPATVRHWIRTDRLPAVHQGGKYLISGDDLGIPRRPGPTRKISR